MNVHFIQHEMFEAPGAYLEWVKQRNHNFSITKVYEYQPVPTTVDDIDLLIIMGGPQSPDTTIEQCEYFNAKAEVSLIQKCIKAGKAIVGVCLGAQLLGTALGAKYERSPEQEIGIFPIALTSNGLLDEKIRHFGSVLSVGHWHNDMPGITPECRILANSIGCPRQIIAFSDLVYGFQCHMEFTTEVIELLLVEEEEFLASNTDNKFIQKPNKIRSYDFKQMNKKLYLFLDKLCQLYKVKQTLL